ncbi:hypothetical protein TELCIR_21028, partial [Teladorsagia circumcincta]
NPRAEDVLLEVPIEPSRTRRSPKSSTVFEPLRIYLHYDESQCSYCLTSDDCYTSGEQGEGVKNRYGKPISFNKEFGYYDWDRNTITTVLRDDWWTGEGK